MRFATQPVISRDPLRDVDSTHAVREGQVVSKVLVKRELRFEFLEELRRMNIHEASLFPGLDGFSRFVRCES